jgi:hypothetical protein
MIDDVYIDSEMFLVINYIFLLCFWRKGNVETHNRPGWNRSSTVLDSFPRAVNRNFKHTYARERETHLALPAFVQIPPFVSYAHD